MEENDVRRRRRAIRCKKRRKHRNVSNAVVSVVVGTMDIGMEAASVFGWKYMFESDSKTSAWKEKVRG